MLSRHTTGAPYHCLLPEYLAVPPVIAYTFMKALFCIAYTICIYIGLPLYLSTQLPLKHTQMSSVCVLADTGRTLAT